MIMLQEDHQRPRGKGSTDANAWVDEKGLETHDQGLRSEHDREGTPLSRR